MLKLSFTAFTALILFSSPTFAHVTADPNMATAGAYFKTSFRVSHGCDGSPTKSVTIDIPKGFLSVKPQHKQGWKIDIVKRDLEKPVAGPHGKMATQEFTRVTWTGGPLPDSEFDEFGLVLKIPDDASGKLWFPVTQECAKGELKWDMVPADGHEWHDVKSPAPFIDIMRDDATSGVHHH